MTPPPRRPLLLGAGGAALVVFTSAVLLVIAAAVSGVVGGGGCGGDGGPGGGSQQIGPRIWSGEQTANAQLITSVVTARALPRRAAVIAVSTAIVESGLRNITYGDRDSLGLFQQRPSQGWGAPGQILNPATATATFLEHLVAVPGWSVMPAGVAEQTVQASANPGAYAPQEPAAADLVARFWVGPDNPLPLSPAPGSPGAAMASFALPGCPDQGDSNLPLAPGSLTVKAMPPGYTLPGDPRARAAITYAIAQLGKPYVWGATGPNSFDCSGLVMASWASAGIPLSRTTSTQVRAGAAVAGIDQIAPGDLLFIPGADGTAAHPGHVGLAAGHGLVIDAYDNTHGVIVENLASWAPKIVAIRRPAASSPAPPPPAPAQALAAGRAGPG
jgi:hypothetical protein